MWCEVMHIHEQWVSCAITSVVLLVESRVDYVCRGVAAGDKERLLKATPYLSGIISITAATVYRPH